MGCYCIGCALFITSEHHCLEIVLFKEVQCFLSIIPDLVVEDN